MTDQRAESAMRDACDLEYLVTLVTDACTTDAQRTIAPRHRGYCRRSSAEELLAEIAAFG